MAHILFFSDIHYSKDSLPSEKRWFPGIVSLLGLFSARFADNFLRFWDFYTQRCFGRFLDAVSGKTYAAAFCLGDMTPGVLESGLASDKSVQEANELKEKLFRVIRYPVYFIFGNHDVGYMAPIGYQKGGMTIRSLEKAADTYQTELFYTVVVGGVKFCVVTSGLVAADARFGDWKKRQLVFLQGELSGSKNIFLLLHDAFALRDAALREVIGNNLPKIEKIVCGDVHAASVGHMMFFLLPFSDKIVFVPSVGGFLGFGRGFVEMEADSSGYEFTYKRIG